MVINPKNILWPTDFSPLSLHGGRYARAFRDVFGAKLHLLHVIPPPTTPDLTVMVPAEVPASLGDQDLLESARRALDRLVETEFGGDAQIARDAVFGNPWVAVCEYAQKNGVDLIIVPTHGRTGLAHVLIGSTAERIVQHAPCPVLTVKSGKRDFLIE